MSLSPEQPTTEDDLVASASGKDAELRWYRDGEYIGDYRDDTIPAKYTHKGESWAVSAIVPGEPFSSEPAVAVVKVVNSPPTVEATLGPDAPTTADDLVLQYSTADADDDTVTIAISWLQDGERVDGGRAGMDSDRTSRGEVWQVTLVPSDDEEEGEAVTFEATIGNTPPELTEARIVPSDAYQDTVLELSLDGTDADTADRVSFEWTWVVEGEELAVTDDTLSGEYFSRDDIVYAVVTATDGTDSSAPANTNVVSIGNSAPLPPEVAIDPASPASTDDLVCVITADAVDIDDDDVSYTVAWTVNGTAFTGSTTTTTLTGDTVLAANTDESDRWECTVTASDGRATGRASALAVVANEFDGWPAVENSLASADPILVGDATSTSFLGWAIVVVPDMDGDGLDDVVVGAPRATGMVPACGAAYVKLGSSLVAGGEQDIGGSDYAVLGTWDSDYVASSLAALGDVDGDGMGDILIGAPESDGYIGAAYLIMAADLSSPSITVEEGSAQFEGEGNADYAGTTVASAGDLDGDGLTDLAISAVGNDDGGYEAGKAYIVLSGSLGGAMPMNLADADYAVAGDDVRDNLGVDLGTAGDVDGDGYSDLVVTAAQEMLATTGGTAAGLVYLWYGDGLGASSTLTVASADVWVQGAEDGDMFGGALSHGDLDADGVSDLVVGASGVDTTDDDVGAIYVFRGSDLAAASIVYDSDAFLTITGDANDDQLGQARSDASSDFDQDGVADLLIGSSLSDFAGSSAGRVALFLSPGVAGGRRALSDAEYLFDGESADDLAGTSVAAGDLNGDGVPDIAVGAPWVNGGFARAYILFTP